MGLQESLNRSTLVLSRRDFLKIMAAGAAGSASLSPEVDQTQDRLSTTLETFFDMGFEWDNAKLSNEKFIERNKFILKDSSFSSSFSPEKLFGLSLDNYKDSESQKKIDRSLGYLEFLHDELGIEEIRLGVRWDNVIDEKGNFDFGLYEPYFDCCIKNGIDISLNLGIKVYWWPEEHIPKKYSEENTPAKGSTIGMQDQIVKEYIPVANKILEHLTKRYTKEELKRITKTQPGNEIFNSFGEKAWVMDNDFTVTLTQHIDKFLPDTKILVNSSEFKDLKEIYNLFAILSNFIDSQRLIVGVDYYPFIPGYIDPVFLSNAASIFPGSITLDNFIALGYANPEITELQTGSWLNNPLPSDQLTCIKYMLQRSLNNILTGNAKIGFWDMEDLLSNPNKLTPEIFDLFKKIKDLRTEKHAF